MPNLPTALVHTKVLMEKILQLRHKFAIFFHSHDRVIRKDCPTNDVINFQLQGKSENPNDDLERFSVKTFDPIDYIHVKFVASWLPATFIVSNMVALSLII